MRIPAPVPYPATAAHRLHSPARALLHPLKARLQHRLARCYAHVIPTTAVAHAVEEAATLALSTDFPTLFFPVLAEEAVRAAALSASPDVLPFKCAEPRPTPRSRQPLQIHSNP